MKKLRFNNLLKIFLVLLLLVSFVFINTGCKENNNDDPGTGDVDPGNDPGNDPGEDPGEDPGKDPEPIDVSKVKFFNGSFTYDGKEHSIAVSSASLPNGVTVEYEGNNQKEIGSYTVTATLKDANGNVLKTIQAKLTINKIKRNISKVSFADATYVWENNKEYELVATNIPDGVYAVYENNKTSSVGTFDAKVKLYDSYDDELLGTLEAKLIVKYRVVVDEAVFTSANIVADGEEHKIVLSDSEEAKHASVEYSDNKGTKQGYYLAKALVTEADGEKFEYHAVLDIQNPRNEEFAAYVDEMFVYFLEGDQSTLNIFMADYESFGFEHQDADWYKYEKYTTEDNEKDKLELADLKNEFAAFNRDDLNSYQQIDYDKIKEEIDYLDYLINNPEKILMRQSYIDQFGGYCGDFPTTMEAYTIREKQDIEDIISYVDSTHDAYMSYIEYAKDRAAAGYAFTNTTISKMVEYLDGVSGRKATEAQEPYYLIAILEKKIRDAKATLSLSDDEVADYITRLDAAFVNFIQANIDLAEGLESECMGLATADKELYLGSYGEDGKELYEILLRNRIGIDMSMEDYIAFLDSVISKYYSAYTSYKATGNSAAIGEGKVKIIDSDDPLDMIEYLKEFAKTIVPDLESTPEIDVTYMDETATANTTTVAYYMKSALDSYTNEYIHLNAQALGNDYLETMKTLAHEGYPGHLYAYVTTKENENLSNFVRVSTCTGHGEAWAKYVEIALGDYLVEQHNNKAEWKVAMNQGKYWDLFIYAIYTRVDVGLGYQGWTAKETLKFLKNCNLNVDEETAKDIALQLAEMPGQYAAYGYGQAYFFELHEEAREILGEAYNEIEFNAMLLSHGWVALSEIQVLYDEYMAKKCFMAGIN